MNTVALEVRDLVKTFSLDGATLNAVDGVSFQVKSGEFVALVDPAAQARPPCFPSLPRCSPPPADRF